MSGPKHVATAGYEGAQGGATAFAPGLHAQLVAQARRAWPEEGCGLLLGSGGRVLAVSRLGNHALNPEDHYMLDPLEYMRAEREADRRGLAVLGIWHSHPGAGAEPSAMDSREAWPEWLYVIVGWPRSETPDVRGWRLWAGSFHREVLRFCQ